MEEDKDQKQLIQFIMIENRCSYVRAQLILEESRETRETRDQKGGDKDEYFTSD